MAKSLKLADHIMAETAITEILDLRASCGSTDNGDNSKQIKDGSTSKGQIQHKIAALFIVTTVVTLTGKIAGKIAGAFKAAGATANGSTLTYTGSGQSMGVAEYKPLRDTFSQAGVLGLAPVTATITVDCMAAIGYAALRNFAGVAAQLAPIHTMMGISHNLTAKHITALSNGRTFKEYAGPVIPEHLVFNVKCPAGPGAMAHLAMAHRWVNGLIAGSAFRKAVKSIRLDPRAPGDMASAKKAVAGGCYGYARFLETIPGDKESKDAATTAIMVGYNREGVAK